MKVDKSDNTVKPCQGHLGGNQMPVKRSRRRGGGGSTFKLDDMKNMGMIDDTHVTVLRSFTSLLPR